LLTSHLRVNITLTLPSPIEGEGKKEEGLTPLFKLPLINAHVKLSYSGLMDRWVIILFIYFLPYNTLFHSLPSFRFNLLVI
jgi:hypothetical protein